MYNSTNSGTNKYEYNNGFTGNDYTKNSMALYNSTLNDETSAIKLWNNSVVIRPHGFINNVAIYDSNKMSTLATSNDIKNYVKTNGAIALFV